LKEGDEEMVMKHSTLGKGKSVAGSSTPSVEISVDGAIVAANAAELLVEAILREKEITHR
jgi:hypothetical protein